MFPAATGSSAQVDGHWEKVQLGTLISSPTFTVHTRGTAITAMFLLLKQTGKYHLQSSIFRRVPHSRRTTTW